VNRQILIVGGSGHIGSAVARDLHQHTLADLVLAGRDLTRLQSAARALGARCTALTVDLDRTTVDDLVHRVRGFDLVIQCVGPFRTRPPHLLLACLQAGVNYVDVCDDRRATQVRLGYDETARAAGVTALIDTGTFPGIDNVLVAHALARNTEITDIHLHFVCAGSGGGGFGVLQTTFLAVNRPYEELQRRQWVSVPSYRGRRVVDFGQPMGNKAVYTFEVPEIWSLATSFPSLHTVTSHFGTVPALWNWATAALAAAPESVRSNTDFLDAAVSFTIPWVHRLDRWVGEALAIRVDCLGPGLSESHYFYAPSTTEAVGWATGAAAAMVLDGEIRQSGVLLPETHIPLELYLDALRRRGATIRSERYTTTPIHRP
jgi:saccharopine dehydrogenase-like NADP-dependent oxidoreductase